MSSVDADVQRQKPWSPYLMSNDEDTPFLLMRRIDDTMEKTNHHTEEFPKDQHGDVKDENTYNRLYDDVWKSEESDATSLHEVPIDYLDSSGREDTVNNAITEVFSDFMSGERINSGPYKYGESDESHSDVEFKSLIGLAYVARYPETATGMSDNDWNPYGTESDSNISPRFPSNDGSRPSVSSLIVFNPPLCSTDLNANTPSVRMCSVSNPEAHMVNINDPTMINMVSLLPDITVNFSSVSHVSEQKRNSLHKPLLDHPADYDLNKTLRNSDFETSAKSHTQSHENVTALHLFDIKDNTDGMSKKHNPFHDGKALSGNEYPTQLEQKTLPKTQVLEKMYIKKHSHNRPVVDYNLLQQDLQDIQNSLRSNLGPHVKLSINGKSNRAEDQSRIKIFESSDSECDIIPSTTTTPDREHNKMAWDFAADLGYHQPGDLMGDISLETFTTNSHRPSDGKKSYNSDGDETRTSGSSDKVPDHADISQLPPPQTDDHTSFRDVDLMLFHIRNQREQIESRYQQLNSQGLAEKVCRILSSQNPQSQVNGLLSEISAQEREMNSKCPLNLQSKDFNFSAISSHLDESSQSLALLENVRKRLDLSGLSSADASKLADKSSMNVPLGSGFTALDGMTQFLSSQMAKALERTFNHSIEKIVPQRIIQCYPLTIDNKPQETTKNERSDKDNTKTTSAQSLESGANRMRDNTQTDISEGEKQIRNTNMGANTDQNKNSTHLYDDSDSSTGKRREKYRPYRPAGSKEVYYTESDVASVADSVTTMESTHFGSDDARGPMLPLSALGSRQDAPNVAGIYGNRMPLFTQEGGILPPIQEKSGLDERETESSQSNKGDKTSESQRSQGQEHNVSSDRGIIAGMQQGDGIIRSQDNSKAQDRHVISRDVGKSVHVRSEIADSVVPSPHDTAETRSIARWANFRAQKESSTQEQLSRTEDTNSNQSTREHVSERNYRDRYISQRSRFDEHQLPGDRYRRPTGTFVGSEYSHTSGPQIDHHTEPLSLRHSIVHDDVMQRVSYAEDLGDKREITYSARNAAALSKPRFYSGISDSSFKSRYGDAEKLISPHDPLSMNKESYLTEKLGGTISHSHSDDDLYDPGRGAHISPLFRDALSPGFRRAIRSRSPILSRHIERSLSQPPSERPDHYQRDMSPRGQSPPPLFLARERGEPPRDGTTSQQKSLISTTRSNRDRPWSPLLQVRVASPSSSQEGLAQHSQSLRQAESKMVPVEEVSSQNDEAEMDRRPVSKRVQLLTQALTHEKEQDIRPDIGCLWEQFKANNESNESCLSSSSLDAVTDLLLNPSPHLVNQCLKEREEHIIERQERAEAEREKRRTQNRLEWHPSHQNSSEEELLVGYAELLAEKEMERMKRRMARKKKGKSPGPVNTKSDIRGMENIADKLFSIPEDASFEQTPKKSNAKPKMSKVTRQPHIIDPNMEKLRDRIFKQKQKIDKPTLKEIQRIEKLKKLELLLLAKKNGEISDQTLEMQLEEISSTSTPGSDNSQQGWDKHAEGHNTTPLSDDSTTVKDSSNEMNAWKTDKEIRIKEMKSTDKGLLDKHKPFKTIKDKSSLSAKTVSQGLSMHKLEISTSQSKLLKLVKEGYLTPEEAYRLAVEREALAKEAVVEKSSLETSHGSSSDEFHGSHNSRLHRLYSPYSRDDSHSLKTHYVPKLKLTPSVYDVADFTYPKSWYKHGGEKSLRNLSAVDDHNDSHPSDPHARNEYIHPKLSLLAHSKATCRDSAAKPSSFTSRSVWQKGKQTSGISPSRQQNCLVSSPNRREKQSQLSRSSPSRREHIISPTRARSFSPQHKKGTKNRKASNKGTHGSYHHERTCRSENEPPLRKKTPERRGVAWHVPIDLHHGTQKVPKEKARKKLPLQESKLTNNTLPKKTADRSLQIEELEPMHGWQQDREVDHKLWHKVECPQGIPCELWKHIVRNDALASKVNHWEVDPLMDRVQYILNKHSGDSSTEDDKGNLVEKNLSKMSLQEAFLAHKQSFISKCKERQKRLALSSEHRKMQEYLRLEREAIFLDQERITPANLNAHPYSDNLYQPRRRLFSKQEMKELTMKRYKKLPEVLQKQESDKRIQQCKINRLRVNIFNRKVQREHLRKQSLRRC